MKSFLVALVSISLAVSLSFSGDRRPENPEDPNRYPFETRLVFFSVLEGLYETGVTGEALDLLIPDPEGMWIEGKSEKTNFVYACPICTPAFDALRLYQSRKPFYGQKATRYNTFGPGLDEEILTKLRDTPEIRRKAIRDLINTWVARRLKSLNLSDEERVEISKNLETMKNEGEEMLKSFQAGGHGDVFTKQYEGWKSCPFCDGAAAAGKM